MIIEYSENEALNGLFSFIGRGKENDAADKTVKNRIEQIKNDHGFNDLMFMKPEQAANVVNRIISDLSYEEAREGSPNFKNSNNKEQQAKHVRWYSDASSSVMTQFRQYALGLDGEVKSLGESEKTVNGVKFKAPYYKLILPQSAQNTTPTDGVSTADLLSLLSDKNSNPAPVATAVETPAPAPQNTALIVGGSVLALALVGGIIYAVTKKKK
ncbi:hypothetical protein [Pseudotamlana carrageenivorans]|uniref:Uncharacterized protein n=1 Tax=Pseudotamlana carrageenivorans TaxID=2069432 RepID=A0A2I7SEU1_9FLAO|nr:hypothetical protein [Tamlana carrageenivorans]AUS04380.1 hypothetical protein C1A40_02335 [Tamlana carrageenivorans]